jgi:hypothetical protein
MVMEILLSAIIAFGYVSCLDPRLVDFVWFEEPEIDPYQYLDVKNDEKLETPVPKMEGDGENMKQTVTFETLFERNDDEAFAKYFFLINGN